MKRRGFTLAELLAVIVILGLIAVITIPVVTKTLGQYKVRLCEDQIANIVEAARVWGSDHLLELPDEDGGVLTIRLSDLQSNGYIDDKISDPMNAKETIPDIEITITKVGKKYQYQANYTCKAENPEEPTE